MATRNRKVRDAAFSDAALHGGAVLAKASRSLSLLSTFSLNFLMITVSLLELYLFGSVNIKTGVARGYSNAFAVGCRKINERVGSTSAERVCVRKHPARSTLAAAFSPFPHLVKI